MVRTSKFPSYKEVVARNSIDLLKELGDLKLTDDGDLALTSWGDLMINNNDYSAFGILVSEWQINYPTLAEMFEASLVRKTDLNESMADVFLASTAAHPHPLFNPRFDPDAYQHALDTHDVGEVAADMFCGTICIVALKMLVRLKERCNVCSADWNSAGPTFGNGYSFGRVLESCGNNVRHHDEWAATNPPKIQQLHSIKVLASVLDIPLTQNGANHSLGRELSAEILARITNSKFEEFETAFFSFAKDLIAKRNARPAVQ